MKKPVFNRIGRFQILLCWLMVALFLLAAGGVSAAEPKKQEGLSLDLPDEEGWKLADQQEDKGVHFMEITRGKETVDNWTELVTLISQPAGDSLDLQTAVNALLQGVLEKAPKAKYAVVDKDTKAKYPWVLLKVEASDYPGAKGKEAESDLYYIVKGQYNLFIAIRAVHKPQLTKAQMDNWSADFRKSKVEWR